jgi:hypothetical protein
MKFSSMIVAVFVVASALFALIAPRCSAVTWYVDGAGSDSNSGTQSSPFAGLGKAVSVANPGNIVYIDAGTYALTNAPAPYSGTTVTISRSGAGPNPITIQSTPGQSAVINAAAGDIRIVQGSNDNLQNNKGPSIAFWRALDSIS